MSLRFRKSINLGHGIRLNIGKKGVGISAGVKGARVSINSNGRKTTSVGIPGTGISYVKSEKIGNKKTKGSSPNSNTENQNFVPEDNGNGPTGTPPKKQGCLTKGLIGLAIIIVLAGIGHAIGGNNSSNTVSSLSTSSNSMIFTSSLETDSSELISSEESSAPEETSEAESSSSPSSAVESSTSVSSAPAVTKQKLVVTSAPGTVSKGSTASISIKGKSNTQYSIAVHYSSGVSKASGLEAKASDANGNVSWSWKIGVRTKSGTYDIVISDGTDEVDSSVTVS